MKLIGRQSDSRYDNDIEIRTQEKTRVLNDVTIYTFEISGTRMEEREGHKISDHATDSNKGYEADRTIIGLTIRQ